MLQLVEPRRREGERRVLLHVGVHLEGGHLLISQRHRCAAHLNVTEAVLREVRRVVLAVGIAAARVHVGRLRTAQVAHVKRAVLRAVGRVRQKLGVPQRHVGPCRAAQPGEAHHPRHVLAEVEDLRRGVARRYVRATRRTHRDMAGRLHERRRHLRG